jgi:hypothetical protein
VTSRCCYAGTVKKSHFEKNPMPVTLARRCHNIVGWLLPAGGLVMLPKCPACLAAYLALMTGIGISVSAATYLRMLVFIVCIASVAYFAATRGLQLFSLMIKGRPHDRAAGRASISHGEKLSAH